jgi:antitoxin VapB
MEIAKLSTINDRQAVILPENFHFDETEVYIKKIGSIIVLISKENPWQALWESLSLFSEDFLENREQPALEIREAWGE